MAPRFFVETLGCPKNAVDSDKVVASLLADGLTPVAEAGDADLIVVNTCAFIEAARQESIDTALALSDLKRPDARLVVTGCMAERYGTELAEALPEADAVVGFAGEGSLSEVVLMGRKPSGVRDLLELPRPAPTTPWAYVKVAEGCDRACAFCAIPSFRGKQRSRTIDSIEAEVRSLVDGGVAEIVLVAQDLAWYGRDIGEPGSLAPLLTRLDRLAPNGLERVRLLYLYPSEVRDPLLSTMLELPTVVPYFDLSLQHASAPLMRSMKRWGSGDRFVDLIGRIRASEPQAAFRSSFIVGFPGETEADHDTLLHFLRDVRLDWAGFFPFSIEDGTPAATLDDQIPAELAAERLRECSELQDPITQAARDALVGETIEVLVDGIDAESGTLVGRTHREAPEIDGLVHVTGDAFARPGALVTALVTDAEGPDLMAHATAAVVARGIVSSPALPTKRFGPGAVATPANAITIARILFAVPTLILIERQGATWLTVSLWFVLSCTDGVDGWIARRDGTTRSGAFLDPIADKFLTIGGFVALVARGDVWWFPVALIAAREIFVSIYRSAAARRGISLPARQLGKWKAALQMLAVGAYVFPPVEDMNALKLTFLWVAVAFTIISAVDIVRRGWQESASAS